MTLRAVRTERPRAGLPLLGALAVSLLLAGCSAGADTVAGSQASGTPSTAGPVLESPPPAPTAVPSIAPPPRPSSPARRVIAVTVAGGKVTGVESRVPVKLGEALELRVTSDVAEQVHVHGYDLAADVAAGGTIRLEVDATIPGSFEVELEKSHKTLFQLRVS